MCEKVPKNLENTKKIPFDFMKKSDYNGLYTAFLGVSSTL